jgi:hypothetical protein
MERAVREFPFADRAPAFSRLVLGIMGELWVSEFDPSTNLPGPPARFVPYEMGRDYVAGVSFADDGVERVTLWRLHR